MYNQGAKGTLVVPLWKSAVFWPTLTSVYYTFIQDLRSLIYGSSSDTVRNRNSILGSLTIPRYVVVLRMNVELLG